MDLNCDMGEATGAAEADDALLATVTSANIACGFHAGGPAEMDAAVRSAVAHGVTVGAHVSYPDRSGFGRRHLEVSDDELIADVLYQTGALQAICRRHGTEVRYLKAHGALYNDMVDDERLARAYATAVRAAGEELAVLALAGSPTLDVLRECGITVIAEAFADRAYTAQGRLVSRRIAGAVISDPQAVAQRAWRMAAGEPIESLDGPPLTITAGSVCVHGDTAGAIALAREVRRTLTDHGMPPQAFAT